uniref:BTB domain-containing protein n=1 Tax=Panagrolaimus davidi TaxID=227884 RepID=A0A914QVX8_9BILA
MSFKLKLPFAIQWKIPKNHFNEFQTPSNKYLKSDTYNFSNIPGLQYCLKIYPNDEEFPGECWIYLFLTLPNDKMNTESYFVVTVESANFSFKDNYVFDEITSGRGKKCCKTEELFDPEKKFIIDEEMTIKVDGFFMVEKNSVERKIWSCKNFSGLLGLGLWAQENSKDFTIFVDEKKIDVHKCVLSAVSPVFARMFESGMKESEENKVTIKDFTYEIVETAIKYCYHSSLVTDPTIENKMKVLQFFDKYNIQPFKDDLENFLISEIHESNVCFFSNAALLSNSVKLEKKMF